MNLDGLLGIKKQQTQAFLEDGQRVPLSVILASGNVITQVKTTDKEGYDSVQLGMGVNKKANKAELGNGKKAGLETSPRFFRELKITEGEFKVGDKVEPADIFKPGDIVDVIGQSKGKGFAGVVKRHHFKGGPRTHGQSDRERAPGSIGQTTTPGRVYRGKRMAGRMGDERTTVKNLEVLEVKEDGTILVKGLVPGSVNSLVIIKKVGENKKFVPLYKEIVEQPVEEVQAVPEQTQVVSEPVQEPTLEAKEEANVGLEAEASAEVVEQPTEEVQVQPEVNQTEATEEVKEGEENASK
jgi:large subunit ribosomal protein L3